LSQPLGLGQWCRYFTGIVNHNLTFSLSDYRSVVVIDDDQYDTESTDNSTSYESIHRIQSRASSDYYSKRGVRLSGLDGTSVSRLFLFHGGGRMRDTNVVVHNTLLYLASGVSLCCVELSQLNLRWDADLLTGADNGIYFPTGHDCILAVGDFDLTSLRYDGSIIWHTNAGDLLTAQANIDRDFVTVYGNDGCGHTFSIETGLNVGK
jgi:hypothetical protein